MRHINIKISYDSFKSRLPGVIPSLVDSWSIPSLYMCDTSSTTETYYSHSTAIKRALEYNISSDELEYGTEFIDFNNDNLCDFSGGNYGLIPSDVIIPSNISDKIADYTDIYVNIPKGKGDFYDLSWPESNDNPHYVKRKIFSGNTEIKILTYNTLNKWYTFFKKYYSLIKNSEYTKSYTSATDYYEGEVKVKNDDLKKEYEELDNLFNARGGDEMYEWITKNCIVQYTIPHKYVSGWEKEYLYYPEVIKWYRWFKERHDLYGDIKLKQDCVELENCSECEEYVKRGGDGFHSDLEEWIRNININTSYATKSASIVIPISITTSIDDLGEMSIFSDEWDKDVDYHNRLNNSAGTVVINSEKDDSFVIKNSATTGHEFDETFLENKFKDNDWSGYTDYYIKNNKELFAVYTGTTEISAYTYSPINGKVIYNPTDDDATEYIKINKTNNVCINGVTYDVINGKYVELCYDDVSIANISFKKHEKLQIFKDGKLEYAILNGKRKYVEVGPNNKEMVYFLKGFDCDDSGCTVESGSYIIYGGSLYLTAGSNVTMEDNGYKYTYPILDGYFDLGLNRLYVSGSSVVLQNGYVFDENASAYTFNFREINDDDKEYFNIKNITIDSGNVKIVYEYDVKNCKIITGRTDSKLDLLRRKEISTDDLGNELPGYFRSVVDINSGSSQSKYNTTYDECTLDILYRVGEVSELKETNLGENIYLGNIITNIEFFYNDKFGNKIRSLTRTANTDNALEVITALENAEKDDNVINQMMCEITYYIGAIIKYYSGSTSYSALSEYSYGVKYKDVVYVSKEVGTYYMNDDDYFTFSYYLLSQDVEKLKVTDLNANLDWDASTHFEMNLYLYDKDGSLIKPATNYWGGFSKNNGVAVLPVFRTDYNLASSFTQNVDADIYIDRGISAAFEKHLKLQEIRTMDALENYQNSGLKINEY